MALYFCGLPKTGNACLIVGKTIRQIPIKGHLQSTRPVLFNTVKVIKTKKCLRNLQLRGTWEDRMTKCYVYVEWNPVTEKRH